MTVRRFWAAGALLLAISGCGGEPTGSNAGLPTVLVTNATCEAGHCATLEIRAFLGSLPIPQGARGLLPIGEAPPGRSCLTFPASWTVHVTEVGSVDTTLYVWTPDDAPGVYVIAIDSQAFQDWFKTQADRQADSALFSLAMYDHFDLATVGETVFFVPGGAPGWSVDFPSTPILAGPITQDAACNP